MKKLQTEYGFVYEAGEVDDTLRRLKEQLREALEQNTKLSGRHSVTLNQYQLLRAVEQCGGIFTGSDLTIEYVDEHECAEDDEKITRPAGLYLYWTDYPEEGSTPLEGGELTEDFECIVCHVCGNERTIANGATGTDPRGYSDCTNCADHKGPPAGHPPAVDDTRRLNAVAEEYLHVVPFDMPTGAGDADVGWDVLQSTTGMPEPALLARVFEDNPRKAIDAAIANEFRAVNPDGSP